MRGPFPLTAGVFAAISDRAGGASWPPYATANLGGGVGDDPALVRQNRAATAAAIGLPVERVVFMNQVHGREVAVVSGPASPGPVDALLTSAPGLALAVLVADCVPVLLADSGAGVIGAAHAGRQGLAAGVVPALIQSMAARGADPAALTAFIGPAICRECYEVPADLRAEVCAAVPQAFARTRAGTPALDVRAGVAAQLRMAGVTAVRGDDRCTREDPELFSYRRDGVTGRFAAFVWREP